MGVIAAELDHRARDAILARHVRRRRAALLAACLAHVQEGPPMRIQVVYGRRSQQALPGMESPNRQGLAYTYEADPPISVGDIVLVPASFITPEPQLATVVDLESDYDKPVKRILRVVEHTE